MTGEGMGHYIHN
ncbi:uncharacterized protein ARMOST_20494 [Armillaria ostoyae]|uniref:Uncharacterized protein n=1 Tax=Armillaria ostoyae TaxID=47428 RepID=A0A284S7H5_ARMOS|nr:uncharacterized protein ARMOST_20494 [Armillaria ostoyae]